jgi:hypothetical protein
MKKLITICLLLVTTFTTVAQEKVSKEITIAFIKKTLESVKGTQRNGGMVILEYDFDLKSISIKGQNAMFPEIIVTEIYSLINWEKMISTGKSTKNETIFGIVLSFNTPIKYVRNEEIKYQKEIRLEIPKDKYGSLEKAFLRLAEIAKEENKDPFEN